MPAPDVNMMIGVGDVAQHRRPQDVEAALVADVVVEEAGVPALASSAARPSEAVPRHSSVYRQA